jgi:hypothetical protein
VTVTSRQAAASRRPRGRLLGRATALALGAAALFLVGMAVGRATDEDAPTGTRTLERTLRVDTLTPAIQTVTVTVENGD